MQSLKISLLILLVYSSTTLYAVSDACKRSMRFVAAGVVQGAVASVLMPTYDVAATVVMAWKRKGFMVTRRGVINYLWTMGLRPGDLENKHILDLGGGYSPFAKTVNRIYGETGSIATTIDKFATPKIGKYDNFVRGDAEKLPLATGSQDLVVSSWFYNLMLPDWTKPKHTEESERRARQIFSEMLRVTKPGGEIRFTYSFLQSGIGAIPGFAKMAKEFEDVEFVETHVPFPFTGYVRVKKKI